MRKRTAGERTRGIIVVAVLAASTTVFGQVQRNNGQPAPKTTDREAPPLITSLFPPAAMIGGDTKLAVEGINLKTVEDILVSGEGIESASFQAVSESKGTVVLKVSKDAREGSREVRAAGSGGLSNLLVVRFDRLEQTVEVEPNDAIDQAKPIANGAAIVGRLTARDLDHYLVRGAKGRRVTIEVEARRLGAAVTPIVTILSPNGVALAQAHETRGLEGDCRLSFRFPSDGDYVIQVRDKTYRGGNAAVYRLRVAESPFATAMFPLGGPKGSSIAVRLFGGNLSAPVEKTLTLPDAPGTSIDPGVFETSAGSLRSPWKLVVGDGATEVFEQAGSKPSPLPPAAIANGRIDAKGEVDRYAIAVKKGTPILLSVRAATLGSWLDSVLTLRDAKGNVLAESDDPGLDPNAVNNNPFFPNNGQTMPVDSRIEYLPTSDGELSVEIEDRFGDFGPEFAYRLEYGPPRPDFTIKLLLSNPAARVRVAAQNGRMPRFAPGTLGAFNLKPGAMVPVNFLIESSGRTGPIEVSLEGLPPGVSCKPVTIRLAQPFKSPQSMNRPNPPAGGVILVRVNKNARPSLAWLKVVATAKSPEGATIRRVGDYAAPIETGSADNANNNQFGFGQQPPPTHVIDTIPLRVLGDPTEFVYGPPRPTTLVIREFQVMGALLQGGSVDATLLLDSGVDGFKPSEIRLEATPIGAGITAEAIGVESVSGKGEGDGSNRSSLATVRLHAAPGARLGAAEARLKIVPIGGEALERTVLTPVLRPFSLHPEKAFVAVSPGVAGSLYIGVERAPGFAGAIDVSLEGLPEGVSVVGPSRTAPGQSGLTIGLNCVKPISAPQLVTIAGVATLPGGKVRVESAVRATLSVRVSEKVR